MLKQFFRAVSVGLCRRFAPLVTRERGVDEEVDGTERGIEPILVGEIPVTVGRSDEELAELVRRNEGEVLALLAVHDGVMRQGRIVEETGWSPSKVSYTLANLEERERIEKIRIGRENVIRQEGAEHPAFDAYTDTSWAREPGR
jgi:hypothetical protein